MENWKSSSFLLLALTPRNDLSLVRNRKRETMSLFKTISPNLKFYFDYLRKPLFKNRNHNLHLKLRNFLPITSHHFAFLPYHDRKPSCSQSLFPTEHTLLISRDSWAWFTVFLIRHHRALGRIEMEQNWADYSPTLIWIESLLVPFWPLFTVPVSQSPTEQSFNRENKAKMFLTNQMNVQKHNWQHDGS